MKASPVILYRCPRCHADFETRLGYETHLRLWPACRAASGRTSAPGVAHAEPVDAGVTVRTPGEASPSPAASSIARTHVGGIVTGGPLPSGGLGAEPPAATKMPVITYRWSL